MFIYNYKTFVYQRLVNKENLPLLEIINNLATHFFFYLF
jgi:hypothetical protein